MITVGPMKAAWRRALMFPAVCIPVAMAGQATSVSAPSAVRTEHAVSQTVHPPMLKAALEGSSATVARHTAKARVAYQPARIIALTFDDGPGVYTPKILAILKARRVKATFFVVGRQVRAYPSGTRALAGAGMSVQNHTWNHPSLAWARPSAIWSEITTTDERIRALTGVRPTCVRPPGGAYDSAVITVAARGRHRVVNWSNDPGDWKKPGVASIRSWVLNHAANNGIVLLHDGGGNRSQTVTALPGIIDGLRARGYSFVTLCQR